MKRLVVCVLLAACDGGGGSIAIDDLGHELAEVGCGKQWDCCTDAELMEEYMGVTIDGQPITMESQCVDFANALLTGFGVAQWKESLAAGRIAYDGDAAADCVAAVDSVACANYSDGAIPSGSDCRPFIIPKVADGGGCTQDFECTSHNCVGATNDPEGADVDGACMPMPQQGEECTDNCADGLTCEYDTTNSTRSCQPLHADGEDCTFDDDCASDYCDDMTSMCGMEPRTCDGR